MIDRLTIIQTFVQNFVTKEKAERCYGQLADTKKRHKFTDRLNHQWDTVLRMEHLTQVQKYDDDGISIQRLLNFADHEPCYVISNYSLYDDRILLFQDVFGKIYAHGLGSILLNLAGDTLFLETEQERGPAARFIGRVSRAWK